jgi:hypothetical protein
LKLGGSVLYFDVDALRHLEVEADPAGLAIIERQFEIEVVGTSPDEVQVDLEGANHLFLDVEGLNLQKLPPQLVLVRHELKRLENFPLHKPNPTYAFCWLSTSLAAHSSLCTPSILKRRPMYS